MEIPTSFPAELLLLILCTRSLFKVSIYDGTQTALSEHMKRFLVSSVNGCR